VSGRISERSAPDHERISHHAQNTTVLFTSHLHRILTMLDSKGENQ
jgi:hypothetical protein